MNGNSARLGSCKTVPRFLWGCSWTTFEWPSQLSVYGAITSHIYLLTIYRYQTMINKQCFTGGDVSIIQQGKRSRWSMWLHLHRFSKAKLPFHRRLLVNIHWIVQRYINIGSRTGVAQCLSRSEMPPALVSGGMEESPDDGVWALHWNHPCNKNMSLWYYVSKKVQRSGNKWGISRLHLAQSEPSENSGTVRNMPVSSIRAFKDPCKCI